ncbi:MAG: hypothetical protein ABIH26_01710 [Candidatus Eisenbacteria bacterium]
MWKKTGTLARLPALLLPLLLLGSQIPIAHDHAAEPAGHADCPLCLAAGQPHALLVPGPTVLPKPARGEGDVSPALPPAPRVSERVVLTPRAPPSP